MSFPTINFKITNTDVEDAIKTLTEDKLSSLDKFIGEAPCICDVEFEKITNHHQQGNIHRVEVNLEVNGQLYRAEATSETFEKAVDEVREDLWNKMQSAQGKKETIFRKGARKVKELIRWG